jgi:hypothetical protein
VSRMQPGAALILPNLWGEVDLPHAESWIRVATPPWDGASRGGQSPALRRELEMEIN